MKTLMIATIAGAMALSGAAQAGDWVLASGSSDTIVGYDRSSAQRQGSRVTVWTVYVSRASATVFSRSYDYYLSRVVIDCTQDTIRETNAVYYSLRATAAVYRDETLSPDRPITPDTIGAGLKQKVCSTSSSGAGRQTANDFAAAMRAAWPV